MATAVDTPPATAGDDLDFDDAINRVAGHLNTQHARLVDLTITMLGDDLWHVDGIHTPEQFLAWRTGLAPQRARQIISIARRATELPTCFDRFRRGELAIDQMAAIAKRAPWWADDEIGDLATMLTVSQLRRTLATYPFPDFDHPDTKDSGSGGNGSGADDAPNGGDAHGDGDHHDASTDPNDSTDSDANDSADPADSDNPNDTSDPADGCDDPTANGPSGGTGPTGEPTPIQPHMWWGVGDDGVFRLHAECDPLYGLIISAALEQARDALFQAGHTDVDDIDAFTEMAERSLDTVTETTRRERFRTNIHLRPDGTATDAHGWNLPDAIRRYITCDGLLSPTFVANGIPVSVGRSQRIIPQRTRRLVVLRDQGCRVPGCNVTHHVEIHHIIHWEHDGPTDTWNLITLCPRHHRLHHRGELGIAGDADTPGGVEFTNRHGRPVHATGARPTPPGVPPPPPPSAYRHPLGERLDHRWLYFNPPPEYRQAAWAEHPYNPARAN